MLRMSWVGGANIDKFERALRVLGSEKMNTVAMRATNRAGDQGRTAAGRALARQAGLRVRYVTGRMRAGTTRASAARPVYTIGAAGGDIPLKYFDARETARGVSARPFGRRQVFASTFIKGGLFPNRKDIGRGGHVFTPQGKGWGRPFTLTESGVVFPTEMVSGSRALHGCVLPPASCRSALRTKSGA